MEADAIFEGEEPEDDSSPSDPEYDEAPPEPDFEALREALVEHLDTELVNENETLRDENLRLRDALSQSLDTDLIERADQLQKDNDRLQEDLLKRDSELTRMRFETQRRKESELNYIKMVEELKEDVTKKMSSAGEMEKQAMEKAQECEYLRKQVKNQKMEVFRLNEIIKGLRTQMKEQNAQLSAELTEIKRRERNKNRALSTQIETEKSRASNVAMQMIDLQRQVKHLQEEKSNLKRKLNAFERQKQFSLQRETLLKDEVERLLKENHSLETFQVESLDKMSVQFDEQINTNEPPAVILEDNEDQKEQSLIERESLDAQLRNRSYSEVSAASIASENSQEVESPKALPIPPSTPPAAAPPNPKPAEISAELVYTRLCAMAVALKFSHLGHYNSELLKLSKVCVKNDVWKWYEVYDELVKYMESIEETLTGAWEEKQREQQQGAWTLTRLLWGNHPE